MKADNSEVCQIRHKPYEIRNNNGFAITERPQIIVGMSAPTSGMGGNGDEAGAAPS